MLNQRKNRPIVPANVIAVDTSVAGGGGGGSIDFQDDFNDNSIDAIKWTLINASNGVSVVETNQELQLINAGSTNSNGLKTALMNTVNRTVEVELKQISGYVVYVLLDGSKYLDFEIFGSTLRMFSRDNTGDTFLDISYDATNHRFLRFKYLSVNSTLYWETSADGITWVTRRSVANLVFNFASCVVALQLNGNSSTGTTIYDNFKIIDPNVVSSSPSGQVALSWNRRNRLTQTKVVKQSDADVAPETSQLTHIKVYNNTSNTLLRTESAIVGTSYNYTAVQEIADSGVSTLSNLRIEIEAIRSGLLSFSKRIKIIQRS